MLQQTQVKTVIPFYQNFLRRFPRLQDLAQATESEVLAHWSGLGYYRRAKLLHQGAQWIDKNHQGKLPHDVERLKKIPGIGPYTAGAIASIAFNQPSPLVDGNVIRVFSRLFCYAGNPKSKDFIQKIWEQASTLVDPEQPGDFNQALMELGATVCRKYLPSCQRCPVQSQCLSFQKNCVDQFPETPPSQKTIKLWRSVAICENKKRILLVKRHQPRWFHGMWELPHDYCHGEEAALCTLSDMLKKQLKSKTTHSVKVGSSTHHITHHRIESLAWRVQISSPQPCEKTYQSFDFFEPKELDGLPLPNFERKVLQKAKIL